MGKLLRFLLSENTGRKVGMLGGFIIGLSIVLFGFWKTVFLAVCTGIGYIIGRMMEHNDGAL